MEQFALFVCLSAWPTLQGHTVKNINDIISFTIQLTNKVDKVLVQMKSVH